MSYCDAILLCFTSTDHKNQQLIMVKPLHVFIGFCDDYYLMDSTVTYMHSQVPAAC